MLEAITYQKMLLDIQHNQITEDTIGILITRPDLDGGKSIINSLNYYHHLSGKSTNFYLPGFGAYWYEAYPDEREVTEIDGAKWYYSDKMFVDFISDLEKYSKWQYSGETELLMLEYKDGILSFDNMMCFYLDNMLRDNVIVSVPSFFQQLFRIHNRRRATKDISNTLGRDKAIQITKDIILDTIPAELSELFVQEKYFSVKNCGRKSYL